MAIETNDDSIARAIAGNEAAQRALYEAHHAAAFRLAYLLLQDACDAEEVLQDAFVYVFRNLERYDPQRGSFWAWLRVTLVSRCRNKRRRKRLPTVSLDALTATGQAPADREPAHDPAGSLERRGAQRAMRDLLQQVSAGAREALVLRYYEDLPYAEIADLLGCSPEAARARVAHGKVQLKRLLAEAGEETVRLAGATHLVGVE
jgi:RNA polymerase sigma-70 factor (ECF subfamily)